MSMNVLKGDILFEIFSHGTMVAIIAGWIIVRFCRLVKFPFLLFSTRYCIQNRHDFNI